MSLRKTVSYLSLCCSLLVVYLCSTALETVQTVGNTLTAAQTSSSSCWMWRLDSVWTACPSSADLMTYSCMWWAKNSAVSEKVQFLWVQNFSPIYATQRFINLLLVRMPRQMNPVHTLPCPFNSTLVLSSHLNLGLPSCSLTKTVHASSPVCANDTPISSSLTWWS